MAGGDGSLQAVIVKDGDATSAAPAVNSSATAQSSFMTPALAEIVLSSLNLDTLQERLMHILWDSAQSAVKEDGAATCR